MHPNRALLALALAAALAATGCPSSGGGGGVTPQDISNASTLAQIQERGTLRVAMEVSFWPFEYKDEKGQNVGFDVDLAQKLAEQLGVKLEIVESTFEGIIPSLVTGKVDLAISGITATLQRARQVSFSEPYHLTGLCILARKDSPIQGPEDLDDPGLTIALKQGTTGFIYASEHFKKAKHKLFDEEAACAQEVAQGRADAFVYDELSVWKHQQQNAQTTKALLEPFTHEPYAIMFRQGEPDLGRYLDQFVREMQRDGTLGALRTKHFSEIRGR